jgi:hypothetical protein
VYALDAATGHPVWQQRLGAPVPRSALPCGDINPLGITGTPVIDESARSVYLDALVDENGVPDHRVFGLSLDDGSVRPGWPIRVAQALGSHGMAFDPATQNQRGALALALVGGRLYVPFGGHFGDCGNYHGWVVGLQVNQPQVFGAWSTRAPKGGIWAPGGISSDGRSLFAATGNTQGAREWGDGEAVIRLPQNLERSANPRDFFAPANWAQLDAADLDISGVAPLPIDVPAGRGVSRLLLALGKNGDAYLLDRDNLGGIGGALAVQHVANEQIITAPAVYRIGDATFVAMRASGSSCPEGVRSPELTVLTIVPGARPGLRTAWCGSLDGRGSPIVTTADGSADPIVWIVGAEGDSRLHGFRGDTGQPVFDGGGPGDRMGEIRRFSTILAAENRLYVAGDGRVYAFGFAPALSR